MLRIHTQVTKYCKQWKVWIKWFSWVFHDVKRVAKWHFLNVKQKKMCRYKQSLQIFLHFLVTVWMEAAIILEIAITNPINASFCYARPLIFFTQNTKNKCLSSLAPRLKLMFSQHFIPILWCHYENPFTTSLIIKFSKQRSQKFVFTKNTFKVHTIWIMKIFISVITLNVNLYTHHYITNLEFLDF